MEDLDYGALGLGLLVYIGLMTLEDFDYGALALDCYTWRTLLDVLVALPYLEVTFVG